MRSHTAAAGVILLHLLASLAAATAVGQDTSAADELARRLRSYIEHYEPQLSRVVADETFEQFMEQNLTHRARRRLTSEMVFLRLPGNHNWLAQRSVRSVDGQPVGTGRASLFELLKSSGIPDAVQARMLVEEAASYNIGLARTINVPTVALDLLHPRNQSRFTHVLRQQGTRKGRSATRLVFSERPPGGIVQAPGPGAVRTIVEAWVDRRDGSLLEATVDALWGDTDRRVGRVRVGFARDEALVLLVPEQMDEWFEPQGHGTATYSNYRRFATAGRVLPPPAGH